MRQRVAIAIAAQLRAQAADRRRATTALDVTIQPRSLTSWRASSGRRHMAMILITTISARPGRTDEVPDVCRGVEAAPPAALRPHRMAYTAALLARSQARIAAARRCRHRRPAPIRRGRSGLLVRRRAVATRPRVAMIPSRLSSTQQAGALYACWHPLHEAAAVHRGPYRRVPIGAGPVGGVGVSWGRQRQTLGPGGRIGCGKSPWAAPSAVASADLGQVSSTAPSSPARRRGMRLMPRRLQLIFQTPSLAQSPALRRDIVAEPLIIAASRPCRTRAAGA